MERKGDSTGCDLNALHRSRKWQHTFLTDQISKGQEGTPSTLFNFDQEILWIIWTRSISVEQE